MKQLRSARAHRVEVPDDVLASGSLEPPDYASTFEAMAPDAAASSAEQWAQATFEQAPKALRWLVLFGWTTVLRLRLGPRPSAGYVLGWKIVATAPDSVTLEVRSSLITARKVVDVGPTRVTMTTFVHYERQLGRFIWSALAPVHHLTEPLLLTRAASRRNVGW